jgi:hypothetical protein
MFIPQATVNSLLRGVNSVVIGSLSGGLRSILRSLILTSGESYEDYDITVAAPDAAQMSQSAPPS